MKLLFALLSTGMFVATLAASDESTFSLSPSGLRLTSPSYNGEDSLRAFNHAAGLNLVFDVVSKDRIQEINFGRSRVISAVDDTGRDLVSYETKGEKAKDRLRFWSAPPTISKDGLACQIETSIFSPFAAPSKGATKIYLKAEIFIRTTKEETLVPVELTYSLGIGN